jgi:hypothetical protein
MLLHPPRTDVHNYTHDLRVRQESRLNSALLYLLCHGQPLNALTRPRCHLSHPCTRACLSNPTPCSFCQTQHMLPATRLKLKKRPRPRPSLVRIVQHCERTVRSGVSPVRVLERTSQLNVVSRLTLQANLAQHVDNSSRCHVARCTHKPDRTLAQYD